MQTFKRVAARNTTSAIKRVFTISIIVALFAPPGASLLAQSSKTETATAANAGSIYGSVLTETTERPLMNAQVTIAKLGLTTRTDSLGNFLLSDVPFGTHNVAVRLDGFEPLFTEITVVRGEKVGYDLMLKERVIQYAPPATRTRESKVDLSRMGLDERRSVGTGHFITEDMMKAYSGKPTADVIKGKMPALHAAKMAGDDARAIAMTAGGAGAEQRVQPSEADRKAGAKADCYVSVLLNNSVVYLTVPDRPLFDVNSIPSGMIMNVEYFNAVEIPSQYALAASPCGLLVIQTRGR